MNRTNGNVVVERRRRGGCQRDASRSRVGNGQHSFEVVEFANFDARVELRTCGHEFRGRCRVDARSRRNVREISACLVNASLIIDHVRDISLNGHDLSARLSVSDDHNVECDRQRVVACHSRGARVCDRPKIDSSFIELSKNIKNV